MNCQGQRPSKSCIFELVSFDWNFHFTFFCGEREIKGIPLAFSGKSGGRVPVVLCPLGKLTESWLAHSTTYFSTVLRTCGE